MIQAVDVDYPYPSTLSSTVLEGSLHQYFLKGLFPSLTDCHESGGPTHYFTDMVFNCLKAQPNG